MPRHYIRELNSIASTPHIGNKAERLRFLIKRRFRVPKTYVCTWDAYQRYVARDPILADTLRSELTAKLQPNQRYAIRSSANVEDNLEHSFAGQFTTVLDVQGIDGVLEAIQSIWASTQNPGVLAYLKRNSIEPSTVRMGVLIQEMAKPILSGVSFSKNPMTGMDEIIIEAVQGRGDALMQEGVTPLRWINKWGEWISRPEDQDVGLEILLQVVDQTREIAAAWGKPVDLEWVFDGKHLYWVQLREITSIDVDVYSNHIAKERAPGILKPLVYSVGLLATDAWVRLLTELIGPNDLKVENLTRSFYNRVYFNMGALGQVFELLGLPRETLELLMGLQNVGPDKPSFKPSRSTYLLLPRMARVALNKLRFSRELDEYLPQATKQYQSLAEAQLGKMEEQALFDEIQKLYSLVAETSYHTVVTMLLMQTYTMLLKRQLRRLGIELSQFALTQDMPESQQYDPNAHLLKLSQTYRSLDPESQVSIRSCTYEEFCDLTGLDQFQNDVREFIEQFGYLRDNDVDFSSPAWQETPDIVLKMIANYVPPKGDGPGRISFADLRVSPVHRPLLRSIYRRTRQFLYYRDVVSYLHKFGYGLFRPYFLALADHLLERGLLESTDDIYYLHFAELQAIVEGNSSQIDYRQTIRARRGKYQESLDIRPPSTIFGNKAPPTESRTQDELKGTPTSHGAYTGPLRVIQGIRDFDKVREGDVLAVPYSDVGWTPLFAKAGAVVAESGGILSHSSIVAREYGIPAVVSVPNVCDLQDGTVVTVDGFQGRIIVHETAPHDL